MGEALSVGNWYILQSKSRKEYFLLEQLRQQKIRTYFPCFPVKRVNPRARKIEPYFPGYLFFQADLEQFGIMTFQHMINATGLVKFGNDVAIIEDYYIREIQQKIDLIEGKKSLKSPILIPGDDVSVLSGVFSGHQAIFDCHLPGSQRVRLLLQWLKNCYIKVEMPSSQIGIPNPKKDLFFELI
jgi:transcription antitermination factor NusG